MTQYNYEISIKQKFNSMSTHLFGERPNILRYVVEVPASIGNFNIDFFKEVIFEEAENLLGKLGLDRYYNFMSILEDQYYYTKEDNQGLFYSYYIEFHVADKPVLYDRDRIHTVYTKQVTYYKRYWS